MGPGLRRESTRGYGANRGLENVLTNGSLIFVPENTVAFVFSQAGIERVIAQPGGYEYQDGQVTIFDEDTRKRRGLRGVIGDQMRQRISFAGNPTDEKRVAFVNMREIRGVKFGTHGPLAYHDLHYDADLELQAHGVFSVRVSDPVTLIRNFVPANCGAYSLDFREARKQLVSELLHSFAMATNQLSAQYRISQLPSQADAIVDCIKSQGSHAGSWDERYGLQLTSIAIEAIEFSDDSRKMVLDYTSRKMSVSAYEGVSSHASDVSAQQKIADGVREHGLGDAAGMMVGMGFATHLEPETARRSVPEEGSPSKLSFDEQLDRLERLKKLLDAGILTQEEFDAKKREVLGL